MDMSRICDRYGFTVAFFHIQTRARLKPHKHVFWPRVFLALSEGIPITSPRKRPTETHGLNGVISTFNSWFLGPNPFFVHLTPEEFESAIISGHFGFEFEQISVREIRNHVIVVTPSFTKSSVFKFLRLESRSLRFRYGLVWTVGLTV